MPIACVAAEVRGQLKHTFLENTLLALSEPLLRVHLAENVGFERNMASLAAELTARLSDDYDPANLIDRLAVFDCLTDFERSSLRDRLRQNYMETFDPDGRQKTLTDAWQQLASALTIWRSEDALGPTTAQSLVSLQTRASEYHAALDALPRGVWLG